MIMSRTPLRISMLGGGTDYREWFMEHGGAVIAAAINHYAWVTFNNGKTTITVDLPERSGLGTSSARTVGLLKILAELKVETNCDPRVISQFATLIEQDKLAGNIGVQDQYVCSGGGFMLLRFSEVGIREFRFDNMGWLNPYLMLFHTHQYRKRAGDVVSAQLEEMADHTKSYLSLMDLVEEGLVALDAKDWELFGNILHESWMTKRELSSKITTPAIDDIYERGTKAGAIGGKILGSGGGGAMLFLSPLDKQEDIKKAIPECEYIPFKFEKEGTKIILRDEDVSDSG